jgi:Reverse transcriptase (RNA-dependent DNA polymerase)
MLISLAAYHGWKLHQLDVKSAFLNGVFEEEVNVEQPEGFIVKEAEKKVYCLKKTLYGLKQVPRVWNTQIDGYLEIKGFIKCQFEHALYMKKSKHEVLIICLYVDDLLFIRSNPNMFREFKQSMFEEFEMADCALMGYFLGIEIKQQLNDIFNSQKKKYSKEILEKFKMTECNFVGTSVASGTKLTKEGDEKFIEPSIFKSLVGNIRYLTIIRPDIVYGVGLVSRYMEEPKSSHLLAAKQFSGISKEHWILACFIQRALEKFYMDIQIVIREAIKMKGRAPLDMCSFWGLLHLHESQRNKTSLLFLHARQNMWQQFLVHVKLFG